MHPAVVLIRRLLLPAVCLSCGHDLAARERAPLCPRCRSAIQAPPMIAPPAGVDRFAAAAVFDGPARDLVHRAKYGRKAYAASYMGDVLAESARDLRPGIGLLVPVPLPAWRRIDRGFNPAEEAARKLGRLWRVPVAGTIIRRRMGFPSQTSLGRVERLRNARRSFAGGWGLDRARGKSVLLVDDVCTSGATLSACAGILHRAGASGVSAAVFAWEPLGIIHERRSVSAAS